MLVDRGPAAECGGPRAIVTVIEIAERFSRWETQSQLNITVSIAWSRRMAIAVDDGNSPAYVAKPADSLVGKVTVVRRDWHREGKQMLASE